MMEYKRLTTGTLNGEKISEYARINNRLFELENKIEQGTLVDLEAYFIVEENQWAGKNRFLVCRNGVHRFVCDFCETREEAEKRLKEIRNA